MRARPTVGLGLRIHERDPLVPPTEDLEGLAGLAISHLARADEGQIAATDALDEVAATIDERGEIADRRGEVELPGAVRPTSDQMRQRGLSRQRGSAYKVSASAGDGSSASVGSTSGSPKSRGRVGCS